MSRLALIVITLVTLGGCVRPYVRDTREPRLATHAPCRPGEACAQGGPSAEDGFEWATEVMESAR